MIHYSHPNHTRAGVTQSIRGSIMEKDWDYLEPGGGEEKPLSPAAQLCRERLNIERGIKIAKERLSEIDEELKEEFPRDIGDWSMDLDGYLVRCKRGARWTWDTELLKQRYGPVPPKWVTTTYSISRKAYERLDEEEKEGITDALSITRGGAKVSVQEVGGKNVQTEESE